MGLATGDETGIIRLWNIASGQTIKTITGHTASIWRVVFSPDGKSLGSASADATTRVWDVQSGSSIWTRPYCGDRGVINFSPDGKNLVGSACNEGYIFDAATGQLKSTLVGHTFAVEDAVFSPNGKTVTTVSDDETIRLWDSENGKQLNIFKTKYYMATVAYSPDGNHLLIAGEQGQGQLLYAVNGKEIYALDHVINQTSVSFSPDGKTLASSGGNKGWIWDVATGKKLITLTGHTDYVESIAYNSAGTQIVTASDDGTIRLWDAQTGKQMDEFGFSTDEPAARFFYATFSPDDKFIAGVASINMARVWDLATHEVVSTIFTKEVWKIAFSVDSKHIATAGATDTVTVWDTNTGLETLSLHKNNFYLGDVVFSPDNQSIATGSSDGTIYIWDAQSGQLQENLPGEINGSSPITDIVYSNDSKHIAAAYGYYRSAHIWNLKTLGVKTFKGHTSAVESVALNSNMRLLATASRDGTVRIWQIDNESNLLIIEPNK